MLLKPGLENQEHYWFIFAYADKIVHFSTFLFLGFCIKAVFPKIKFWIYFQILLIYAFLTEILQDEMGFGRSLEIGDIIADTLGSLAALYIYRKVKSFQFFRAK